MGNIDSKTDGFRYIGATILCAVMVVGVFAVSLGADEWDQKTIVTFNAPVEVPGNKVLPAGTYVFKRLDSPADRDIVQIWDKDEKHLLGTILAIPDYRLEPAGRPVVKFEESPSNSPPALKAWFYPGEDYGLEFVYTHDRATELAKRTNQNVLSMSNDMAENVTAPTSSASANVQALEKTNVTAMTPAGQQINLGDAVSTKPGGSNK